MAVYIPNCTGGYIVFTPDSVHSETGRNYIGVVRRNPDKPRHWECMDWLADDYTGSYDTRTAATDALTDEYAIDPRFYVKV